MDSELLKIIKDIYQYGEERLVDVGILPPTPEIDREYIILGVEIGHQRCKFALMKAIPKGRKVRVLPDATKLIIHNEIFFSADGFNSFIKEILQFKNTQLSPIDGLAISICCPVNSQVNIAQIPASWGWSQDLKKILHDCLSFDKIVIVNDAVSFAIGCKNNRQVLKKLKFPILCLTLGGGIGCTFLNKHKPYFTSFELGDIQKKWPSGFEGNPHILAGGAFFKWVKNQTNWEEENPQKIKLTFSEHIAWIINSLKEEQFKFDSIILGGGYADQLSVDQITKTLDENQKRKLRVVPGFETALYGVGQAWISRFCYHQQLTEFIN